VSERNDPGRSDDADLSEYLKGGSVVSQRYREISNDEVPADLDRRVLEMARGLSPFLRSPLLRRWIPPLAAAASALVVVSIVIESGVYKGEDPVAVQSPASRTEAPAADASAELALEEQQAARTFVTSAEAPQPAPPVAPAERAKEAEKVAADARRAQRMLEQTAHIAAEEPEFAATPPEAAGAVESKSANADAPANAVNAPSRREDARVSSSPAPGGSGELDDVIVTGARAARNVPRSSGPRETVRPAAGLDEESGADAEAPRAPEEWLEVIRDLRREGRNREADDEWARFRQAHPDYAVAESDIARKNR
jgi:hypothetical protein